MNKGLAIIENSKTTPDEKAKLIALYSYAMQTAHLDRYEEQDEDGRFYIQVNFGRYSMNVLRIQADIFRIKLDWVISDDFFYSDSWRNYKSIDQAYSELERVIRKDIR